MFRNEYLGQLVLQKKQNILRSPLIGEIVMVEKEHSKRMDWQLTIMEELALGKDGKAKLIRLRNSTGSMLRTLQKIYSLEMHESGSDFRQCYEDYVQKQTILLQIMKWCLPGLAEKYFFESKISTRFLISAAEC